MPWARFSDDFYDHPKVLALPPRIRLACCGLLLRAVSWSNRFLTDGQVPAAQLRHFGATSAQLSSLIAVGLVDRLVDGIAIHDFHDYNPSRAAVMADRQAARVRMERVRSGNVQANKSDGSGEVQANNGTGSGEQEANSLPLFALPVPTRPDPSRPDLAAAAVRKPRDAREVDES